MIDPPHIQKMQRAVKLYKQHNVDMPGELPCCCDGCREINRLREILKELDE